MKFYVHVLNRLLLCGAVSLIAVGCEPPSAPPKPKAKPAASEPEKSGSVDKAPDAVVADAKPTEATEPDAKTADKPKDESVKKPRDAAVAQVVDAKKGGKVVLGTGDLTAGIPGEGPLKLEEVESWLSDDKNHEPLDFELPLGLAAGADQIKGVDSNPLTRAKIELGRQLYFDPRLSADVKVSCATCHDPDQGYAAHTQFGVGIQSQMGGRNSPVSYNRILSDKQFWDGRAGSLEDQAVGPIQNPIEMGNTHEACVECLKGVKGYSIQFEKIFGELTIDTVGQALASFERAIVTGPSPFDYYAILLPLEDLDEDDLKEDAALMAKFQQAKADVEKHPISDAAKRGRAIFFGQKGGCTACHVGANFSDEKYHNLGVGMDKPEPDLGREVVTKDAKDRGAFKTPTIRNVALSAPYMHDGSQKTLEEVVEWYAKGGHPNPSLSDKVKKLDLNDQDKKDLVEFMNACTGPFPKVEKQRLPE